MRTEREGDLERTAGGEDREIADRPGTVRGRELVRGSPRPIDHQDVPDERVQIGAGLRGRAKELDLRVRERGARGFSRGLTCPPLVGIGEDPILSGDQGDDRHGRDAKREHGEHEGLATVVGHGVHSMSRAASLRMIRAGSPMNESGAAIA
ncbi:MAG: hypothetical protein QOH08_961 [Chloroflexota bacterium]|nr:hypothetical protein [Chloroflexota bacterium]